MARHVNKKELENTLARLAYEWRGSDSEREDLVNTYQTTLSRLLDSGLEQLLDADSELPDEYMPEDYLSFREQFSLYIDENGHIVEFTIPQTQTANESSQSKGNHSQLRNANGSSSRVQSKKLSTRAHAKLNKKTKSRRSKNLKSK